jgi:uncharacterized protein (TIGR02246 family)
MRRAASEREGYANATELADWLTQKGLPFREAYGIAARLVKRARDEGKRLEELPIEVLRNESSLLDESVRASLTVEAAIARRAAIGGTAPERVKEALAEARGRWISEASSADDDERTIRASFDKWLHATADGDIDAILPLMAEDVVFVAPSQPPLVGRRAFAAAQRDALARARIEPVGALEEVRVAGDLAWTRARLEVIVTPRDGGAPRRLAGSVISVHERRGGAWVIVRDANTLAPA